MNETITEKSTTRIINQPKTNIIDVDYVLTIEEQDRTLYMVTFILLIIILVTTYLL